LFYFIPTLTFFLKVNIFIKKNKNLSSRKVG